MNTPLPVDRFEKLDPWIARALFFFGFAALLVTERNIGFVRDESVYFYAAESYARWWQLLFSSRSVALQDSAIVQAWDFNHEHPALMKSLFGLSHALFTEKLQWLRPAAGFRVPAFLIAALALPALYTMGRRMFGRPAGVFAALAFFLIPRQFFDAHLACFDMPVAAMWVFVVYAFWRAQETAVWWIWTGVLVGLAIATKHNALFLPIVLGPFALWNAWQGTKQNGRETLLWILTSYAGLALSFALLFISFGGRPGFLAKMDVISPHSALYLLFIGLNVVLLRKLRGESLPAFRAAAAMAAMATLGPVIFYLSWPYLWHHPVERTVWWLDFHATHNHYAWFYLGTILRQPPFPLAYVLVKTALTVPITIFLPMAIGFVGVVFRLGTFVSAKLRTHFTKPTWNELLLAVNGIFAIALISMPHVPHFGGTKHWYSSMAFLGILGGAVVWRAATLLQTKLVAFRKAMPVAAGSTLLITLLALPAFVDTARTYPYGTSSYSELAGGLPGAATLGMQRQFWSNNVTGVLPWINANAQQGARLWLHEVNGFSFRDYQKNGMLRPDIQPAGGPGDAHIAVVQYHQEFREHEYNVWEAFGTQKPATGLYLDETPQVIVYKRP